MMPLPVSQAFGANKYLIKIIANIGKLCLLIAGALLQEDSNRSRKKSG